MGLFTKKPKIETSNNRIEVEDMLEQGYKCSEIAEELNMDVKNVYFIKNARERRKARMGHSNTSFSDDNPLKSMELQIKALELQKAKQQLEWDLEDRQAERQAEISEFENVVETAENNPESLLMKVLAPIILSKFNSQGVLNSSNTVPAPSPLANTSEAVNSKNVAPSSDDLPIDMDKINKIVELIKQKAPAPYLSVVRTLSDDEILAIKRAL